MSDGQGWRGKLSPLLMGRSLVFLLMLLALTACKKEPEVWTAFVYPPGNHLLRKTLTRPSLACTPPSKTVNPLR